jgi:AbrB family looped-hinge helix DNA binding protein
MRIALRDKRQVTLPAELCDKIGIKPGDSLDASVEGEALVIKPSRSVALDALKELRRAVKESGVTLEELLEGGRQARQEVLREKGPHLFPAGDNKRV